MSKLSVAIFMASRTHLDARKSFVYEKKVKKRNNPCQGVVLLTLLCDISRNNVSTTPPLAWVLHFLDVFWYINDFWAPRQVLEAIKIATKSWECILWDLIFWSTYVDLLVNISTPSGTIHLKKGHDWFFEKTKTHDIDVFTFHVDKTNHASLMAKLEVEKVPHVSCFLDGKYKGSIQNSDITVTWPFVEQCINTFDLDSDF